jgi:predicted esterase
MNFRNILLFIFLLIVLAASFLYFNFIDNSVGYSYSGNFDREFVTYQGRVNKKLPVIIIHADYNIRPYEYSFLGKLLASKNYLVLVLQKREDKNIKKYLDEAHFAHPSSAKDSSNLSQELEIRAKEISHDLEDWIKKEALQNNLHVDINNLILIGHGHGGDIMMKFGSLYPDRVSKIISLDSRRYPFPRNPRLEILRFGAIDGEPDEGVVPESGVQVIFVKGARHIDLSDRGSPEIKDEIQKSIIQFLDR